MFSITPNWLTLVFRRPDITVLAFAGGTGRANSDLLIYSEPLTSIHLYRKFRSYYL